MHTFAEQKSENCIKLGSNCLFHFGDILEIKGFTEIIWDIFFFNHTINQKILSTTRKKMFSLVVGLKCNLNQVNDA